MKLPEDLPNLIAAAVVAGRLRIIPEGVRALPPGLPRPVEARCRPEICGRGRMLSRLPGIDAYDRMRAR